MSFSASRSWATSSARAPGRTGTVGSRKRAAADGTPSHSYVTTVAPAATSASAASSPSSPTTNGPSTPAPASGVGSRNRKLTPSGTPASPSMRPSWPPPNTATVGALTEREGSVRSRPKCRAVTPRVLVDRAPGRRPDRMEGSRQRRRPADHSVRSRHPSHQIGSRTARGGCTRRCIDRDPPPARPCSRTVSPGASCPLITTSASPEPRSTRAASASSPMPRARPRRRRRPARP